MLSPPVGNFTLPRRNFLFTGGIILHLRIGFNIFFNRLFFFLFFSKRGLTNSVLSVKMSKFAVMSDANGILAQLGEHLPYKQRVIGSSPIGSIFRLLPVYIYFLIFILDGEIAQLARACGSYPQCRGFKSPSRYEFLVIGHCRLAMSFFGVVCFFHMS